MLFKLNNPSIGFVDSANIFPHTGSKIINYRAICTRKADREPP